MERSRPGEYSVATVYCFCMDMINSTKRGLELTTVSFDRFNKSLVTQIKPHLENLGLADTILKFTGDGWLLMTHDVDKVSALCCLATIMAKRFRGEMSQLAEIALDRIPSLRLTICHGRDMLVKLPDGREDWVGDSARRAVRASGCCYPNEILIDETIRSSFLRDFDFKPADVGQRPPEYQLEKKEEVFPLYVLGELKLAAATEPRAPTYFVYTLGQIGKVKEAKAAGQRVAERLTEEALKLDTTDKESLRRNLRSWNRLLASLPDYSSALKLLENILAAGLAPDVVTYNTLINKATEYDVANALMDTMREEGIQPDVVTYDTLINKATEYDVAKALMDTMRAEGIQPNVVTYNTLINRAPNYTIAKTWVKTMRTEGIQPDDVTYNTLINRAPNYTIAKTWVKTMRTEGIQPDDVTYNTLVDKAPSYNAAKTWVKTMRAEGIQPDVVTYSTLINKAPDYDVAKAWVETMRAEGIQPNVVIYSTLIDKAPDYDVAKAWVETMRAEGIQPNVVTYNTLINKAPDYNAAKTWVKTIRAEAIQPDVVTYSTLIEKAPDYDIAKVWVETMLAEGIQPNVITYTTLFKKDLSDKSAEDILTWYLSQEYHPEEALQAAIAAYQRIRRTNEALRLALDYPHLQAARRLIRKHEKEALSYFTTIYDHDPEHPNASYALGVALMELGKEQEAQPYLKKALKLARPGPRKAVIREWLRQIDHRLSQNGRT